MLFTFTGYTFQNTLFMITRNYLKNLDQLATAYLGARKPESSEISEMLVIFGLEVVVARSDHRVLESPSHRFSNHRSIKTCFSCVYTSEYVVYDY